MNVSEKLEWIVGTTGGNDYAIIDKRAGLILAVKSVFEPSYDGKALYAGVRIRASMDPDSDVINMSLKAIATTTYPKIEWVKHNSTRSSLFLGSQGPLAPTSKGMLEAMTKHKVLETIVTGLDNIVGDYVSVMTREELKGWFVADFTAKVYAAYGEDPTANNEAPATKAQVIAFKPKPVYPNPETGQDPAPEFVGDDS